MKQRYRTRGWPLARLPLAGLPLAGLLTAWLLTIGGFCSAQYWPAATMRVDSVSKEGIYRIVLPPSFVARCRTDLSDLRIFDQDGKEAPYVGRTDSNDRFNAGYLPVPDPSILQQDSSDHHSYYWLQYDDDYRIDRLSLIITKPALYKREAVVSTVVDKWNAIPATTITIDPADSVFRISPVRTKRLLIDVANHDNAPLGIVRVATAQSGICLLAFLQPDHAYRLMAGDLNVTAPDYDLHYFTDNTPVTPVTIGLSALRLVTSKEAVVRNDKLEGRHDARSKIILWAIVATVLSLLLYVSVKLARAVDQKQKE